MDGTHTVLALQGCGHFVTEAALRSFIRPTSIASPGRILIPMIGAYAERMARLAREAGRDVVELTLPDQVPVDPASVAAIPAIMMGCLNSKDRTDGKSALGIVRIFRHSDSP